MIILYSLGYNDNCSWSSRSLWQYYRDERNNNLVESELLKFKIKITRKTPPPGSKKDVKTAVSLNSWVVFGGALETPLIDYEINLIVTWSEDCGISSATAETKFAITDTNIFWSSFNLINLR